MATQTTGGGSATSFTNTPQAKDDTYTYIEDLLRANSTLYNAATNTIYLDVMSNDLGGNAKTLFSVSDGDGNAITSDFELLCKDVNASGVSPWEETLNHNWVRINNGKIEYRIADGSGIPGQGRSVESLTDGQNFSDEFVYSIRLGNGTLSEAVVTINITGGQDVASISVVGTADTDATEAGGVANTIPGDPSAGGTLVANDLDLNQNKFQAPPSGSLNGTYGNFTFDPDTGVWTYTLNNNLTATQALYAGQTVTETLTVYSLDGSASYPITVTVHGTNDAPVAVADTTAITENQTITVDVLANDTDVDAGHSFTLVSAAAPSGKGSAAVVGNQLQFNPGTDFDHLAQGATENVTVSYTMQDEHGATSISTLTITVTGTNDGPVANTDSTGGTENQTLLVDVLANDTDVDDGHVLTLTGATAPSGKGTASVVGNQLQFDPGTDFDHLAQGATESVTVSYTMQDEHGATSTSTLTILVTGTNDTPVAQAASNSLLEDASVSGNVAATDADDGATLTYALTGAPPAGLTFNNDGSYTFDASSYDGLAEGEPLVLTIPFTATDDLGATSAPANLTITITGTNDAPVVNDVSVTTPLEDGPAVGGSFSGDDVDSDDDGSSLTYDITSSPSEGSVTNNHDGTFSFDPGEDFQDLAEGETRQVSFTYTATDVHGAVSNTGTVTVTITGANDGPDIRVESGDSAAADRDEGNSGLTASGTLTVTDPDTSDTVDTTATISVSGNQGTLSDDDLLAMFSITDGTDDDLAADSGTTNNLHWAFDSGSEAFDFLAEGQTLTLTYTLTSNDGNGGSDTQDVTITITGTNDTPELTASVTEHTYADTAADDSFGNVTGSLTTLDPDSGDTATYSVNDGVSDNSRPGFDTSSSSAYGTLYLNSLTGAYEFVPDDGAIEALKTDTSVGFTFTVIDSEGATDTAVLTINIDGENDMPELSATLTEQTYTDTTGDDSFGAASGDLSSTDRDSPETATYGVVGGSADNSLAGYDTSKSTLYGKLYVDSATGNYTFVSDDAAIEGLKSGETLFFTLQVTDGSGVTDSETLTINLEGTNDTPEAPATGSVTTDEDTASSAVLIGATDRDAGDTLTYSVKAGSEPAKGSVGFDQTNGTFTYTPDANENGSDSFTILITDADGATTEQLVTVTINPVNDQPIAGDDTASTNEDTPLNLSAATLLLNDTDVDIATNGQVLTITGVTDGANGSAVLNPDGSVTYTPDPNFNGTDTITYTVSDGNGGSDTATVTITVNPVNDAPEAGTDSYTTAEDTALVVDAASGVLGNDSDVDGDTLSVVPGTVATANGGSVTFAADGSFTYTPAANFNGSDSVTYTLSDGNGGFDTGTVEFTVTAVNDAPTSANGSATTDEDVPLIGNLPAASDVDGDTVSYSLHTGATNGDVVVNSDGSFTYTPDENFNGSDSFTFTVSDGHGGSNTYSYDITVDPVNDAPVGVGDGYSTAEDTALIIVAPGVLVNDTDVDGDTLSSILVSGPAHGTLTLNANGSFTYTPDANFNGGDSFTYKPNDGSADGNTVTVNLNVTPVNDAPTSANGSNSTAEDTPLSSTLPAATDVDGDSVTYALGTNAAHGNVVVNANGTFTYTPTADYNGSDSFTFTVSDGQGGSNSYTYSLNVTAVADAVNDSATTNAGTAVTTNVLANDNFEGSPVVTNASNGANGTVTFNGTSTTYTPNSGFTGTDSYTYTVTSGGVTETATVNVTVNAAANVVNIKFVPNANAFESGNVSGNVGTFVAYDAAGNVIPGITFNIALPSGSGLAMAADGVTLTATSNLSGLTITFDIVATGGYSEHVWFQVGTNPANDVLPTGAPAASDMLIVFGLNGTDNLSGGANDDVLYGGGNGSQTDTITGGGADDYLLGGAGNDTLTGNSGADILRGGQDNDTLDGQGDAGQFDLIDLSDGTASSGVLGITFTLDQSAGTHSGVFTSIGLGTDTYSNMEGVIGTNFNDTLTGSNLAADELRGGGGNDALNGQGGNDILKGDAGNDTMTGGAGDDRFVLGPTGIDTIVDYSNVVGNADIIDVTAYLSVAAGTDVLGGQFLRVTTTGQVQIDADGGGSWVTVANVNVGPASYNIQYYSGGVLTTVNVTPSGPPVALDMDGDGQVSFLATDAGATFDYGYGKVATAWVAGNDGILVRDANHDGQASADEVVFATTGSDLDGLAVYDSNHDGQLSLADVGFADFQVWQDANGNGLVEAGEMASLTALGIASISLTSDRVGYSAADGDVQVVGTGSYTRIDGSTGVLADAVFATGDRAEEQLRVAAGPTSNAALLGAVAAAGLMSVPVHAEVRPDGAADLAAQEGQYVPLAPQPIAADGVAQNHALLGEAKMALDAPAAAVASHSDLRPQWQAGDAVSAPDNGDSIAQVSELLAGTTAPAPVAQPLATAAAVQMVSAEMLQAAMAGVAEHGTGKAGAHIGDAASAEVRQVLVDALASGSDGKPDIDSLLNAIAHGNPVHGGNGHADAGHALAEGHAYVNFVMHMEPLAEMMAVQAAAPLHG